MVTILLRRDAGESRLDFRAEVARSGSTLTLTSDGESLPGSRLILHLPSMNEGRVLVQPESGATAELTLVNGAKKGALTNLRGAATLRRNPDGKLSIGISLNAFQADARVVVRGGATVPE